MESKEKESQQSRELAAMRAAEIEKELDERRERLDDLDKEARKKEIALLRISEKSKEIDFG